MKTQKVCAVVPAAGKGTRLGANVPKVFVSLGSGITIWNVLSEKLQNHVHSIQLVLSEAGCAYYTQHLTESSNRYSEDKTRIVVQKEPIGMGDAIFQGASTWEGFDHILVVWGDQVFVSEETLTKALQLQTRSSKLSITIPILKTQKPYVDYVFDENQQLVRVLQSREGEMCRESGNSDVGVFCLSVGANNELSKAWQTYLTTAIDRGAKTKEVNFLPFLSYLSAQLHWLTNTFEVKDFREAKGINNNEDLEFFKNIFSQGESK